MNLKIISLVLLLIAAFHLHGQILFTESFTLILDTTQVIKGTFLPSLKYRNLREELLEIENQADMSINLGCNGVTFANRISVSRFGGETLVSGGYIYGEYRYAYEKPFTLEVFGQMHWTEARGMERKYAAGINARWRIVKENRFGLFAGMGPFYEYERWNYDGISDASLIPADRTPQVSETVKLGTYLSVKYLPIDQLTLDVSIYHQARFGDLFSTPRLASSSRLTFNFTRYLGLALTYQNIYDPVPLVPIDTLFNHLVLGVSITF